MQIAEAIQIKVATELDKSLKEGESYITSKQQFPYLKRFLTIFIVF